MTRLDAARRDTLRRLAALGCLPAAGWAAPAAAQTAGSPFAYAPTRRGGGGSLKLLFWQGPTLLNPHFAIGRKDQEGCRLFHEPLAVWNQAGELLPVLAAEIPSRANGGVAADGRSVTWKLKPGVKWHDGQPFTADDVVFNWRFGSDPATAAVTAGYYDGLTFEKVDALTVRVRFAKPTPFWAGAYVTTQLVPRHLFAPFAGAKSREAPANLAPVGTGPYRFVDFKPGDLLRGRLNPDYHGVNRPHFDEIEVKGGGDAVGAARAVLQTGEFDLAWNIQVEDELLRRMEAAGKGQIVLQPGGAVERIDLNYSDPWTERDGERSHPDTRHPLLGDPAVRRAIALAIDRRTLAQVVYGRTGSATANILTEPPRLRSTKPMIEFDPAKANALLDAAGWKRANGSKDGVREKGGRQLKLLFQTSINAPRQKTQAVVKQALSRIGVAVELKSVTGAVFFSSDVGSADTYSKFQADLQMYTNSLGSPDPENYFKQFTSRELARRANKWQGVNVCRWRHPEFDALHEQATRELDPARRDALFVRMNDLLIEDGYIIPLVARSEVTAVAKSLAAPMSGWNLTLDSIHDWHRHHG